MYQSILVPVDGSAHSHVAVELAAELISRPEGRVYLLNVQPSVGNTQDLLGRAASAPAEASEAAKSDGEGLLQRAIEEAGVAPDNVEFDVKAGAPSDTIVHEAGRLGVDAIVIGSRGASRLSSLILGSVAYRVLHAADCRVVLVR